VSARVNFVVTAETLRADAASSGAEDELELERAGTVRLEAGRMLRVLAATRPDVASAVVATRDERRVQASMLDAIDARRRAMLGLRRVLDARGADPVIDSRVDELEAVWRADWNESLRATREAMTRLQGARQALGLEPAPEEGIR